MCLMCIEIAKGRMTFTEARSALREMLASEKDREKREHLEKMAKASDEELKEIANSEANS